jgi:uncharacterized protein YfaT (DUF1175 family)
VLSCTLVRRAAQLGALLAAQEERLQWEQRAVAAVVAAAATRAMRCHWDHWLRATATAAATAGHLEALRREQVRFCRDRFSATGELRYSGIGGAEG